MVFDKDKKYTYGGEATQYKYAGNLLVPDDPSFGIIVCNDNGNIISFLNSGTKLKFDESSYRVREVCKFHVAYRVHGGPWIITEEVYESLEQFDLNNQCHDTQRKLLD